MSAADVAPNPSISFAAPVPHDVEGSWRAHCRTARRVFLLAVAVNSVISTIWLFFVITKADARPFWATYEVTPQSVVGVLAGFLIVGVLWGWLWYGVKLLLLRRAGLSREEARATFVSRMSRPFDLANVLQGRSERRIRIADMVGRRGRYITLGLLGFWYIYSSIAHEPKPAFLMAGLQDGLFGAIVGNWLMLAAFYSDGFLGRTIWGPQSRIMDGTLGRANALLIFTLWALFRFFMVPLGLQLAVVFPPQTYAVLFAFIWISYLSADALSEIVGSLYGKQKLRVWGMGEVNRKSLAGTWAGFLGSLAVCLGLVWSHHLPASWIGLAVVVSISNTLLELFSPRGTDDFTMATGNALLCWAFGLLVY